MKLFAIFSFFLKEEKPLTRKEKKEKFILEQNRIKFNKAIQQKKKK